MKEQKKEKKEKITYIDDGRTIADMSSLNSGFHMSKGRSGSSAKDKWKTYWGATKMMLVPTLVAAGFMLALYLILALIFYLK